MFMLAGAMALGIASYADVITIHAGNEPAVTVMDRIVRATGMNYVCPADLLRGLRVSVDADGQPLEEVLRQMLQSTGISFTISGNNIVLSRETGVATARRYVLSGFVHEAGTGEALAGVTVRCGAEAGVTNNMGYYSLRVGQGSREVTATYPGFVTVSRSVDMEADRTLNMDMAVSSRQLDEVEVVSSRNKINVFQTPVLGTLNVSRAAIQSTPVLFGESDVIKTLQLEPGVSAGIEGMAGMYVHGGNTDENLYMLDNVPLYQVNHLGGLFSAFNVEALRNVDFYKSSFPARYDGRLSSYMDVNTKDGSPEAHHGSARLGLTSGAFDFNGPLGNRGTTYSVALRRSWFDILSMPACAIYNSRSKDNDTNIGYAFTDLNAKLTHRLSERSRLYAMFYYGEDYVKYKEKNDYDRTSEGEYYDQSDYRLRWGNIVATAGWSGTVASGLFGEVTAAYSRYSSRLASDKESGTMSQGVAVDFSRDRILTVNNINDWIGRADFDWQPGGGHRVKFGGGYTCHSYMPGRTTRRLTTQYMDNTVTDNITAYHAGETNLYASDDWTIHDNLSVSAGAHWSLFAIDGHAHTNLSPRLSARWGHGDSWAVKGGYSRTVQYVHQLLQSSISLPTDQWVPVAGDQKPQTADKIAAGLYLMPVNGYVLSVEAYYKWMDNLLEYADQYYLLPPETDWTDKLTAGKGTAKGIDLKVSKEFGKVTGHVAYSLLWADRQYAGVNGGHKFPARFDNRHKINIMLNYKPNDRWELSAAWTGMSGNRFTLPTQLWTDPGLAPFHYNMLLETDVNNYRLPFYHRLDLSARRNTSHGYWTFSVYNAYCNMNTIAVRRDYSSDYIFDNGNIISIPKFQKIKLIPIIPSVSYTWLF